MNRYPREWSSYFNTLPLVNNQLHWCLLHLLVKSHYSSMYCNIKYSLYQRVGIDSLCRDGANVQYMQYLSKSRITSPQTR